jgi:hypothetical protein
VRHRGVCVRGLAGGDRLCGRGDGLTVAELITKLQEMPQDAVVVWADEYDTLLELEGAAVREAGRYKVRTAKHNPNWEQDYPVVVKLDL